MTPEKRFEKMLDYIVEESEKIDKDTPWSEREPNWWLLMMEVQRSAIDIKGILEQSK